MKELVNSKKEVKTYNYNLVLGHEAHVKVNEDLNRIKKIEPVHTITQLTHPTTKQNKELRKCKQTLWLHSTRV